MTERTQPTDAEIEAAWTDATGSSILPYPDDMLAFARAVLAKWGTPAGAGEPDGRVVSANCQYATVEWLQQTSEVGGGDPDNSRSWPITGDAVYLTPQPTQAQAGVVPLATYRAYALIDSMGWALDDQEKDDMLRLLRAIEAAHGIKGADHA